MPQDRRPTNRWSVLAFLLVVFLVGDVAGGMLANRLELSNWGELAIEFGIFAVVAALAFARWLR